MSAHRTLTLTVAGLAALASLSAPAAGAASPSPAWSVQTAATPTVFPLIEATEVGRESQFQITITNTGGEQTDLSPIRIRDTLPAGLLVKGTIVRPPHGGSVEPTYPHPCTTTTVGSGASAITTVECEVANSLGVEEPARLAPDQTLTLEITLAAPSAPGLLRNRVEVEGGGAETTISETENSAGEQPAQAGFEEFSAHLTGPDGKPATGAATHPYAYTTSFAVNTVPSAPGTAAFFVPAQGDVKQIEVALPPGLAGDPSSVPRCTAQQFTTHHTIQVPGGYVPLNECPIASQVGVVDVEQLEGGSGAIVGLVPIYNLVPPPGMPAQLGFDVLQTPNYIDTRVRSASDYGITAYLSNITEARRITAARTTIWGTPWEASHDAVRQGGECTGPCPADGSGPTRPFLRLPTSCGNPLLTTMSFTTWAQPVTGASEGAIDPAPGSCAAPPFGPTIESRPTTDVADTPSGLDFDLHIPQAENEDPEGLAEADLKDTTVTLPEGLLVNPASADGLAGCSLAQIGYRGMREGAPSFTAEPPQCPDASKVGTVEIDTPLLDHPLPGAVYLATPHENPFNSLIAIYITVSDPQTGVVVKLAGEVRLDPQTGRLTTVVSHSPQLPFEDFRLHFFEGARAPLRTPPTCGTHTTTATLTPWTSPEGADATPTDSFQTTTPAAGQGSCPTTAAQLPDAPGFAAGTESPLAGSYSPIVVNVSRGDGTQEFGRLTLAPRRACSPRSPASPTAPTPRSPRPRPGAGAPRKGAPPAPRLPRWVPPPSAPGPDRPPTTSPAGSTSPAPTRARRSPSR